MITPQDMVDFFLFVKSIGFTLFALAYIVGYMACTVIFIVGALTVAFSLVTHFQSRKNP